MRAASSPDNEVQGGFCVPKGAGGTQGSFPRSCAGSQSTEWGQPGPRKGLEKSKPLIALDTAHPAAGKVQVIAILSCRTCCMGALLPLWKIKTIKIKLIHAGQDLWDHQIHQILLLEVRDQSTSSSVGPHLRPSDASGENKAEGKALVAKLWSPSNTQLVVEKSKTQVHEFVLLKGKKIAWKKGDGMASATRKRIKQNVAGKARK